MQRFSRVGTSGLDAANYLLSLARVEGRAVDPLTLQKLLFYAQCWALAEGDRLFDDEVQAWKHGPVVLVVWKAYSGSRSIDTTEPAYFELNANQMDLVQGAWESLKNLSGFELSELSHREGGAWKRARADLPDSAESRHAIDLSDMALEADGVRREIEARLSGSWEDVVGHER